MFVRTVFYLLLLLVFAGGLLARSSWAQTNPLYTVDGVKVDVTDKNAVAAREKALQDVQLAAYDTLLKRLLGEDVFKTLPKPDANRVSFLVQDFEVTNEQLSAVRYTGVYTVRFRPSAVRTYLEKQGKTYTDVQKEPLLLLPFFSSDGAGLETATLWRDDNIWMAEFRTLPQESYALQPIVIPMGDAADMAALKDCAPLTCLPEEVFSLSARYGTYDVVLVAASQVRPLVVPSPSVEQGGLSETAPVLPLASFVERGALDVQLYAPSYQGATLVRQQSYEQMIEETPEAFMQRVALDVRASLQHGWRATSPSIRDQLAYQEQALVSETVPVALPSPSSTPPSFGHGTILHPYTIQARFVSVQEWTRIKTAVERLPGMRSLSLRSLRPTEAWMEVLYTGTQEDLRNLLQSQGVFLHVRGDGVLEVSTEASLSSDMR